MAKIDLPARCSICKRVLDNPDDLLSEDCGSDCLACIIDAEDGSPAPDLPRDKLELWLDERNQRMRLLWQAAANKYD